MAEPVRGASYVVGFMFDSTERSVLLIRKNRPAWQDGKLNGIGGRIEHGESSEQAMHRECLEEVGLDVKSWKQFCVISDERGWHIYFFYAYGPIRQGKAMTDERPEVVDVRAIPSDVIPNLKWLVPMALSMRFERIEKFDVREVGDGTGFK